MSELTEELRQGEIITGVIQHSYNPISQEVNFIVHNYAFLLSQDCDLLSDYEAAKKGETHLNGVLLYEADTVEQRRPTLGDSKSWRYVRDNRDDRYHFLEAVPPDQDILGQGLPELIIDFRRLFTVSPREIYRQIEDPEGAKRRCRVEMPYREHLQSRAAFYMQRVMLPRMHESNWGAMAPGRGATANPR
jgi:hypothetical protein